MRRELHAGFCLAAVACAPELITVSESESSSSGSETNDETATETSTTSATDATTSTTDGSGGTWCDFGGGGPLEFSTAIDLLIVVDNGPGMADEQAKLVAAMPALVDGLLALQDPLGKPLWPSVNIMVTSTDMGHPLCTDHPPSYVPKQGAPEQLPCTERLDDFTDGGLDPIAVPELCTSACPVAVAPIDPFVHISGTNGATTNVPGNQVAGALQCLVPQGISGCEYGSPLEAMARALDAEAEWNQGSRPFSRPGAALVIAIVSDGYDCSVIAPSGHAYFTDPSLDEFWQPDPDSGSKTAATEAVCWNAGVVCDGPDADGVYADCTASDGGQVLHPLDRYTKLLQTLEAQHRPVFMLDLLGLPAVTAHAEQLPHQPLSGGLFELDYRDWRVGSYPQGDILPGDPSSAADKQFELGIGPGCTSEPEPGVFTGQALPPVRMREVCESLEVLGDPRCCVESVCDADYQAALNCMLGAVQFMLLE